MSKTMQKFIRIVCAVCLVFFTFILPLVKISLQVSHYSYALYDKNGVLLGASVAEDGQWRFSPIEVPEKFKKAIITFEDKRFYFHQGVDLIAVARSAILNIRSKKIVSGASTITMQLVRILEHNKKRTFLQKIKEAFLSLFFEIRYTKRTILELYAANAPFGGNVVGLEAASWRYFNRPPDALSWAEIATLAVLPNAPSLVHPGQNRETLLQKRNELLSKLHKKKYIDNTTFALSLDEELPNKPYALPQLAPHYFEKMKKSFPKSERIFSSIDSDLQKNVTSILERWSLQFSSHGIHNASCIILDTNTFVPLCYIGNTNAKNRNSKNFAVDIASAKRSSGSLLKPFLFCAMLDSGMILPESLVLDVPTRIGSYKPENNIPIYKGAVPSDIALSHSLNIPAIRSLREYGIKAFLDYLEKCGFTTLTRSSDEYGLPLILGGGEITLEEVTRSYALLMKKASSDETLQTPFSKGAAFLTLEALAKGVRPQDEAMWQTYANAKKIAWKTGTSNGNKDAWAIGTTSEYTVGVWIGNAEGQGSPDLKSATTAAPVLFDIFSILPATSALIIPYDELKSEKVCAHSGYRAGEHCALTKKIFRPKNAPLSELCPYCMSVSLSPDGKYRISVQDMTDEYAGALPKIEKFFVLPPTVEYYYKKTNYSYKTLPPYFEGIHSKNSARDFSIMFPEENANIIIPIEIDGRLGNMVMQVIHRKKDAELYWDIDGEYYGKTKNVHELSVHLQEGFHTLTVTDKTGVRHTRRFRVVK